MAYLIKTENSNNIILIALHTKKRRTKPNKTNEQTNKQPAIQTKSHKNTNKQNQKRATFPSVYFCGVELSLLVTLSIPGVMVSVFWEKIGENRSG